MQVWEEQGFGRTGQSLGRLTEFPPHSSPQLSILMWKAVFLPLWKKTCENRKTVLSPVLFHFHLTSFYLFWTQHLDLCSSPWGSTHTHMTIPMYWVVLSMPGTGGHPWTKPQDGRQSPHRLPTDRCGLFIWKSWQHWFSHGSLSEPLHSWTYWQKQNRKSQMQLGLQCGSAAGEDQEVGLHHRHAADRKLWRMPASQHGLWSGALFGCVHCRLLRCSAGIGFFYRNICEPGSGGLFPLWF